MAIGQRRRLPDSEDWFDTVPPPPAQTAPDAVRAPTDPATRAVTGPVNRTMTAPTGGGGGDPVDQIKQLQSGLPPTPDSVAKIVEGLRARGIPAALATHMGGKKASSDAIVLPDGRVIDVIRGWDGPNPAWTTHYGDNYAANRNVVGANGELVPFGQYAQSAGFTPTFTQPFAGGGGGMVPGGAGGAVGTLGAMGGMDPSYGFRFQEGLRALQNSAAAKGTLLDAGTLKALTRYGQDVASTEFGNIFGRNFQLAGLGLNAAQIGAGAGSQFADRSSDLITGGANAGAQREVTEGNVNANTIGGITNTATQTIAAERARREAERQRRAGVPGLPGPPTGQVVYNQPAGPPAPWGTLPPGPPGPWVGYGGPVGPSPSPVPWVPPDYNWGA